MSTVNLFPEVFYDDLKSESFIIKHFGKKIIEICQTDTYSAEPLTHNYLPVFDDWKLSTQRKPANHINVQINLLKIYEMQVGIIMSFIRFAGLTRVERITRQILEVKTGKFWRLNFREEKDYIGNFKNTIIINE